MKDGLSTLDFTNVICGEICDFCMPKNWRTMLGKCHPICYVALYFYLWMQNKIVSKMILLFQLDINFPLICQKFSVAHYFY